MLKDENMRRQRIKFHENELKRLKKRREKKEKTWANEMKRRDLKAKSLED